MFHYNTAILKNLSDFWRLKGDALPSELNDTIVPVFDVRPPANIIRTASAVNTGAAQTLYTTPTDQDFFLTNALIGVIKDVTATSTNSQLKVTIDGVARTILNIPGLTLTVQNQSVPMAYPNPIKVDRGTNITLENSTGVGNVTSTAAVVGFLI
jgi:hypothetical protein